MEGLHLSNLPRLLHLELVGIWRFLLPLIENTFKDLANQHPLETVKIQVEQANWSEDWGSVDGLLSQRAMKRLSSVEFWMSTRQVKQGDAGPKPFLDQFPVLQARQLCSLRVYGRPTSTTIGEGV